MKKKMNKLQNFFATATFVAALMACADALAASSTFTAATDNDNNGYNGTVTAGGDGYAFTAEDSARYYKFFYLYDDLLLDGAVCAGSTNWHTVNIGATWSSHSVTVTVTNGARMVTARNKNILFKGKGGTIVVSEPTDAPFTWGQGDMITTVLGDKTYPNFIGTVGYGSKFTLTDSVKSDTGTNNILRLLSHGTASMQFVSNQNVNVAARILFEGGELRSINEGTTKFQVADGAKIILQSVNGNSIRLRTRPWSYSLFSGAGTLETVGDGDFVLLHHVKDAIYTVSLGFDEGGSIVWGHTGNFRLGGTMCLKLTSNDVLPHGEGKGNVVFSVNHNQYPGVNSSAKYPVTLDLNGKSAAVNALVQDWGEGAYYSKWHVVTNSSETIATLGLDVYSDKSLHEIMTTNLAANAASTIRLKKIGAGKLSIGDKEGKATNILERVAGTEVADGVLWFGDSCALTRPLSVTGSGSIQVCEDVQGNARTLNLSAIPDADLSIGGLTVDTAYYYGKTPTITKFRPAANGKLYLTNVSGQLPAKYTVPINLTTVVDAENFATWKVYVNGEEAVGYIPVYENGELKADLKTGLTISIR